MTEHYWAWWDERRQDLVALACDTDLYTRDRAIAQLAGKPSEEAWIRDHGFLERLDKARFDQLSELMGESVVPLELRPTSADSRAESYDLHLSNSSIRRYKMCRRSWWLSHHRRLVPRKEFEDPTGVASLGSMVHLALQGHYQLGLPAPLVLDTAYDLTLADHPGLSEEKLKELRTEHAYARAMVEGYLDWVAENGVDANLEVVASELTLTYDLTLSDGSVVRITGKLDQVVRRLIDGALMLRDFKTVGDFSKLDLLVLDEQMLTYSLLLVVANTAGRPDGVLYTMLKRSKRTARAAPPFYLQEEQRYNRHQLDNLLKRLHGEAADILHTTRRLEAGEDHQVVAYPNPGDHCRWACPFKHACPLLDDGSRGEDLLAAQFEVGDPWEYRTGGMLDRVHAAIAARAAEKREEETPA